MTNADQPEVKVINLEKKLLFVGQPYVFLETCLNIFFTDTWDQRIKIPYINAFFDRIPGQIDGKTLFDSNETHCNLWVGARTGNGLYGRRQVSLTDGTRKLLRVSRVIYLIQQRTLNIPTRNEDGVTIKMAHLCHNSLCVNPTHLILQEKITNIEKSIVLTKDSVQKIITHCAYFKHLIQVNNINQNKNLV